MKEKKLTAGSGFTLVEMLVVIAIVAILAGILLPVIARSKTKAKVASARIEMKGLEAAIKSYKTDYQRFPVPQNYPRNLVGDTSSDPIPIQALANRHINYQVNFPLHPASGPPLNLPVRPARNSDIMYILMNDMSGLGTNAKGSRNPKKNTYLSPKEAGPESEANAGRKNGVSDKRIYRDPFGNRFKISMDLNRDGYCYDYYYGSKSAQEGLVTHQSPVKWAGHPLDGQNIQYNAFKGDVMIWTMGPDMVVEGLPNVALRDTPDNDNIKSWD